MPKTVRYCINCGREIGESPVCTNPECAGMPNFYRNVPGPQSQRSSRQAPQGQPDGSTGSAPDESRATVVDPAANEPEERSTVPVAADLIAVLSGAAPPHRQYPLQLGANEIGAREPARIVIELPEVSSRHARIVCSRDSAGHRQAILEDHGSTNGTYLNDKKIKRARLSDGDRVRFAKAEFEFRFLDEEEPRYTVEM